MNSLAQLTAVVLDSSSCNSFIPLMICGVTTAPPSNTRGRRSLLNAPTMGTMFRCICLDLRKRADELFDVYHSYVKSIACFVLSTVTYVKFKKSHSSEAIILTNKYTSWHVFPKESMLWLQYSQPVQYSNQD